MYSTVVWLTLVVFTKQGKPQPLTFLACCEPKEGSKHCINRVDEDGLCPSCGRRRQVATPNELALPIRRSRGRRLAHDIPQCGPTGLLGHDRGRARRGRRESGCDALEGRINEKYFAKPVQITVHAKADMQGGEPTVT